MSNITQLLRQCTARVNTPTSGGSGFFVSPNQILTCAHVVKAAHDNESAIQIFHHNRSVEVKLESYCPAADLALLAVPFRAPICVYLDAALDEAETLYVFGYPSASRGYGDYSSGDSITVETKASPLPFPPSEPLPILRKSVSGSKYSASRLTTIPFCRNLRRVCRLEIRC